MRPSLPLAWLSLVLAGLLPCLLPATAHAAPQDPPQGRSEQAGPDELDPARLKARIERVRADASLEAGVRDTTVRLLEEAVAAAEGARAQAAERDRFAEMRARAEEDLATRRRELAAGPALRPEPPDTATRAQLEQELNERRAAVDRATRNVNELEAESRRRTERRSALPQALQDLRQSLAQVEAQLEGLPAETTDPVQGARRLRARADRARLQAEIAAGDAELAAYAARVDVMVARLDLARRVQRAAQGQVDGLVRRVETQRSADAAAAQRQAQQRLDALLGEYPELASYAMANEALTRQRTEVTTMLRRERSARDALEAQRSAEAEIFRRVKRRLDLTGPDQEIGQELRRRRGRLPRLADLDARTQNLLASLARAELRLDELSDQRRAILDRSAAQEELLATVAVGESSDELDEVTRELVDARAGYLDELRRDQESLIGLLTEHLQVHLAWRADVANYRVLIDENILWIRSGPILWQSWGDDLGRELATARSVVDKPLAVRDTGALLLGLAIGAVGLALMVMRRRVRAVLRVLGEHAARGTQGFRPTARALFLTGLLSLDWALLFIAAGTVGEGLFGEAALRKAGLQLAWFLLLLRLLREISRPEGLGARHFSWTSRSTEAVQRGARWLSRVVVPLAAPYGLLRATEELPQASGGGGPIERTLFLVSLFAIARFFYIVTQPTTGVLRIDPSLKNQPWYVRTRHVICFVAVLVPLGIGLFSAAGYHSSAVELARAFEASIFVVLFAVLVQSAILRWLALARRRLAIRQAKERIAARVAAGDEAPAAEEAPQVDLATVDQQARALLRGGVALGLALALIGVWSSFLPALNVLDKVPLWSVSVASEQAVTAPDGSVQTTSVNVPYQLTLADLVRAILIAGVALLLAKNLPGLLEVSLLQRLSLGPGERYAILTILQYVIVFFAVILVAGALGLAWSQVQWLAAAISVGLGFGLQEIFANFVSGLIILLERPIRAGDIVTVGAVEGTVTKIRMRATTITDWDRRELLVPNREFITGQVINWTLSDPITRVVVKVGIAYGSDTAKARACLLEAARKNRKVLDRPEPTVVFRSFGESSLDFQLRAFVGKFEDYIVVIDELHRAVDEAFRKAGIEISFPQRDLHIRSFEPRVRVVSKDEPADESGDEGAPRPA